MVHSDARVVGRRCWLGDAGAARLLPGPPSHGQVTQARTVASPSAPSAHAPANEQIAVGCQVRKPAIYVQAAPAHRSAHASDNAGRSRHRTRRWRDPFPLLGLPRQRSGLAPVSHLNNLSGKYIQAGFVTLKPRVPAFSSSPRCLGSRSRGGALPRRSIRCVARSNGWLIGGSIGPDKPPRPRLPTGPSLTLRWSSVLRSSADRSQAPFLDELSAGRFCRSCAQSDSAGWEAR